MLKHLLLTLYVNFLVAGTTGAPAYMSEAALKAKMYIEKGQLVPDNLMVRLILNQLHHMDKHNWLLDGKGDFGLIDEVIFVYI